MLISILQQFNIDFCAVSDGDITDIILMMPYLPFEYYPEHCARIDSFYIASNTLYKKAKVIAERLEESGFEIVERHLNLKRVAQQGGLGSILHNQLLVNYEYGSKVTLQGISVKGVYEYIANSGVNNICNSCNRCEIACPNGALNQGVFTRENCLRHKQDFAAQYFVEVGGRVLGCEECQNACPYNAHIAKVSMPEEIEKLFDYKNIFAIIKGGKKQLQPLAEVIGSNLARPTYIFNLLVNSLLAMGNLDYTDIIKSFSNHSSEVIRDKVNYYLEKIDKNLQK